LLHRNRPQSKRVVIVGAGAAGTMAAIFAAASGADATLVERTRDGGRKILISGGGRCNILPARVDESRFVTDSSPHTVRHILRTWPLREQIAFFEHDLQLPLVEESESAKLFPQSHNARDVRDKLFSYAHRQGVSFVTDTLVTGITPAGSGWLVQRHGNDPLEADAVVIATGGLSVPHTGSDGGGIRIAAQLGHAINTTYAALTPLTRVKEPRSEFQQLSGISLPVTVTAQSERHRAEADGGLLFTHQGYSGPAILDISHVAVRSLMDGAIPATISVRWSRVTEGEWENCLRPKGAQTVLAAVSAELPRRLAALLLARAHVEPDRQLSQLGRAERLRLIELLVRTHLPWSGDEGYKKAEVTGGGVNLAEVDPKTMESRRHRGLFLCGEMLDAFGPIGGYNFLWAWATGRAAGLGAAMYVVSGFRLR
jgi:predicted Rossmann fold flavoprotein